MWPGREPWCGSGRPTRRVRLRIYLDGAAEPVLEAPMTELLGGSFPGLPQPLAGEYSKGWNLYFPIPYARHCKITSDEGGFYYHVNYRTYEPGTRVESFRREDIELLEPAIEKVITRLKEPERATAEMTGQTESFWLEVAPGESVRESFRGPAAIARAVVRVSAGDVETALRGMVVRIRFDGEACVEAPLGDLFGSGPGVNPYQSLPVGMSADGEMYCHWFMPFRESAEIEVVNRTAQPITLSGELTLQEYSWTEASMHFRAKWRAEFDVPTRPMIDWNYLDASGRGVFAGVAFAIDNPVKDWWGEGDEKIYVDGEIFPEPFRDRHGGLLWLCLVLAGAVYARLPCPTALRRSWQLWPHERQPVSHPRSDTVHGGFPIRHGAMALACAVSGEPGGHGLLVCAAGRS